MLSLLKVEFYSSAMRVPFKCNKFQRNKLRNPPKFSSFVGKNSILNIYNKCNFTYNMEMFLPKFFILENVQENCRN